MEHRALPHLPLELRLRILSLLPPNDLALGGRLSSKEAAQRFSEPHHCTATLSHPLPSYAASAPWVVEGAEAVMELLAFRHKLQLPSTAASSGCEANVELALQLLQRHVFPKRLQTHHYSSLLWRNPDDPVPDLGAEAVASGLAHLLPSLAQRCPGLLDPVRTLEAAARHCDLAGLKAAWGVLGQRLLSRTVQLEEEHEQDSEEYPIIYVVVHERRGLRTRWIRYLRTVWHRMMEAAAASPTPDATAKMDWVLVMSSPHNAEPWRPVELYGAAAASGDLDRLRWLRRSGFYWSGDDVTRGVLRKAGMGFLQLLEREGGYLPPAGHRFWRSEGVVNAAAASVRDGAAKLRWLADRGVDLGGEGLFGAITAAAANGQLEAVQMLVGAWVGKSEPDTPLPSSFLHYAVMSGDVPTATWLHQAGCWLERSHFDLACKFGHLPLVRWLLQAGCPCVDLSISHVVQQWPRNTLADSEGLAEAIRLLAAGGCPVKRDSVYKHPIDAAVSAGHPYAVLCMLWALLPQIERQISQDTAKRAAEVGCHATLEGLVALGVFRASEGNLGPAWHSAAARNGDLGTVARLLQLGIAPGREQVQEFMQRTQQRTG